MRGRLINWGCVGPWLFYLAVAAAIMACAIYLERHSTPPASPPVTKLSVVPGDEFIAELARCQTLGMGAQSDHRCLAAWMENRRRFFGGNAKPVSSSTSQAASHP